MRSQWPMAVHCPDCKRAVARLDLIELRDVVGFKLRCECGSIVTYSAKTAKVTALKQLPRDQKRLA